MANMCSDVTDNNTANTAFGNADSAHNSKGRVSSLTKGFKSKLAESCHFLMWMSIEQAGCVVLAMMRMACQAWDLFQLAQVPPERQYKLSCVYMNKIVDALATGNSACPHSHFVDMVETPIMHSSL
jgi:hypothetical protein